MLMSKPIEDVDGLENEQYIFAINCIDHAHDIDKFLQKIHSFSNENTKIFIAVNTHNYSGLAHFWKIFQKLLEPLHPYHFTENEYTTLFSNSFNIEKIEDIEEDIIWINNLTRTQKDASLIGNIK